MLNEIIESSCTKISKSRIKNKVLSEKIVHRYLQIFVSDFELLILICSDGVITLIHYFVDRRWPWCAYLRQKHDLLDSCF